MDRRRATDGAGDAQPALEGGESRGEPGVPVRGLSLPHRHLPWPGDRHPRHPPPRRKHLEPAQPVHWLARRAPERERHGRGCRGGQDHERRRPSIRRRSYFRACSRGRRPATLHWMQWARCGCRCNVIGGSTSVTTAPCKVSTRRRPPSATEPSRRSCGVAATTCRRRRWAPTSPEHPINDPRYRLLPPDVLPSHRMPEGCRRTGAAVLARRHRSAVAHRSERLGHRARQLAARIGDASRARIGRRRSPSSTSRPARRGNTNSTDRLRGDVGARTSATPTQSLPRRRRSPHRPVADDGVETLGTSSARWMSTLSAMASKKAYLDHLRKVSSVLGVLAEGLGKDRKGG